MVEIGEKFGRLTIIKDNGLHPVHRCRLVECSCECGNEIEVTYSNLSLGKSTSCGCYWREVINASQEKRRKDLTGQTFNYLTAIRWFDKTKNNIAIWECKCICENITYVRSTRLENGEIKSCGCKRSELNSESKTIHGFSPKGNQHPLYDRLCKILQRCNDPSNPSYERYGGRGIKVGEYWNSLTKESIEDFIQYMEDLYPNVYDLLKEGLHIDRIDNDGDYEKGNIRLIKPKQNNRNKRDTVMVEYEDKKIAFIDLYEKLESPVKYSTALYRLRKGIDPLEAILTPIKKTKKELELEIEN